MSNKYIYGNAEAEGHKIVEPWGADGVNTYGNYRYRNFHGALE